MKKLTKLIGLKKTEFDEYINSKDPKIKSQINVRPARLIPVLKTGDEMALSSIFLASLRLVKEFRDTIFKEIKFSRNGKLFYYTEVCFPELFKERIDGMVINVVSGKIKDVAFFEMKSSKNPLNREQIERYIKISKSLKVNKLITISNQFVSDSKESPIEKFKVSPSFNLYHFSWTYLLTIAQILLFDNEDNIEDVDQIEIMKEVVEYLEHPKSGLLGNTNMSEGWKEVSDKLFKQERILKKEFILKEAVKSWHQEEKDLALLLSRSLGSSIKSSVKNKSSLNDDIDKLLKTQTLKGSLIIKNAVSKIDINLDFNRRIISMSIILDPPKDKKNNGKVGFLFRQLEKCKKKEGKLYDEIIEEILIEPDFKFLKSQSNYNLDDLRNEDFRKYNEIQNFKILNVKSLKGSFSSRSKFVYEIENMALKFYEGIIQHLTNWKKPPPKVDNFS
tara:strand:- start:100 stop:1440 length:1341 start_codon:yes stop_codon:yes gene_type:complete